MKQRLKYIVMACCTMATILLTTACSDKLEIQQGCDFTVETMPVPTKIAKGETAEIRCTLSRLGRFEDATYTIRFFQPDGDGELEMDNGTTFLPNDRYPLTKEVFRLYYTSNSTDQQTINVYVEDSFQQLVQLTFSFNNDSGKEEE